MDDSLDADECGPLVRADHADAHTLVAARDAGDETMRTSITSRSTPCAALIGSAINGGRQRSRSSVHVVDPVFSTLVVSADRGDAAAADKLFAALYDELHRMARRELGRRGAGVTLGATTLLHEAYLDISERDRAAFPDRNRFLAYASRVMRGLIIDYARRRQAQKRGGQFEITSIATEIAAALPDAGQLSLLSDALDELESVDPRLARIVDLKFFCGFSFGEIAGMIDASERTVQRDWEKARIYLHRALRSDDGPAPPKLA